MSASRRGIAIATSQKPVTKKSATAFVEIDGASLDCKKVSRLVRSSSLIRLAQKATERMIRSQKVVLKQAKIKPVYGVNTGFGPMVRHIISGEKLEELQLNLLRSHAMGMGEPVRAEFARAAMLLRVNTLACGYSGVSPELAKKFTEHFNAGISAIVPEHGAVGTSGDLVQLAHVALPLIGEGEVLYQGKRMPAAEALSAAGISAHVLGPKEGLSLINGTGMMTGIAALLATDAGRLLDIVLMAGACELELVHGFTDVLDAVLHQARPHKGQINVAKRMRAILKGSKMLTVRESKTSKIEINNSTRETPELLQEVYSLRCIPQIMGPMYEALEVAEHTINVEINGVTDNPIVDVDRELCLHGGNFHGDYVATAVDHLKISLVKLSLLSERRINFFLNKSVNNTFPPFLNLVQPGLTMALQGLQFVATSTAAHNQSLGYPHSLHTISTNGDNQDVVSMGTDAALIASRVLENAYIVAAIELVTLSQAAEFMKADFSKLSQSSRDLIAFVREYVPPVYEDRSLAPELAALLNALHSHDTLPFLNNLPA